MYVMLWSFPCSDVRAETSDRDAIHPSTRHSTINMILKLLFSGSKKEHNGALSF